MRKAAQVSNSAMVSAIPVGSQCDCHRRNPAAVDREDALRPKQTVQFRLGPSRLAGMQKNFNMRMFSKQPVHVVASLRDANAGLGETGPRVERSI